MYMEFSEPCLENTLYGVAISLMQHCSRESGPTPILDVESTVAAMSTGTPCTMPLLRLRLISPQCLASYLPAGWSKARFTKSMGILSMGIACRTGRALPAISCQTCRAHDSLLCILKRKRAAQLFLESS